ncbi:MAG: hypothetical protein K2Y71_20405 [Xanthobacteraceae bacterium]|nr:hypothetical protein [Xanthobacteraceae bacterium]
MINPSASTGGAGAESAESLRRRDERALRAMNFKMRIPEMNLKRSNQRELIRKRAKIKSNVPINTNAPAQVTVPTN